MHNIHPVYNKYKNRVYISIGILSIRNSISKKKYPIPPVCLLCHPGQGPGPQCTDTGASLPPGPSHLYGQV